MSDRDLTYGVIIPSLIGIAAMAGVVLPGDASSPRMFVGFATYLAVTFVACYISNRLMRRR
ncbi:hypothetical protein [Streptomyces sp. SID2119]|uniref:hypothetical protein n=1 Tax=Streptomyces sp. SID2119 TaxID=2690253 RepID=UPI001370F745|nr:hypothetical protein [Streptomyces sp. SID2119]MYW33629.1 hypothetical protein [Streptomyces sp. SID2119]